MKVFGRDLRAAVKALIESAVVALALWYAVAWFPFPALHFVYELY